MWEAEEKSGGTSKIISAVALRRHCAPHLQIASDATAQVLVNLVGEFRGAGVSPAPPPPLGSQPIVYSSYKSVNLAAAIKPVGHVLKG